MTGRWESKDWSLWAIPLQELKGRTVFNKAANQSHVQQQPAKQLDSRPPGWLRPSVDQHTRPSLDEQRCTLHRELKGILQAGFCPVKSSGAENLTIPWDDNVHWLNCRKLWSFMFRRSQKYLTMCSLYSYYLSLKHLLVPALSSAEVPGPLCLMRLSDSHLLSKHVCLL